jgi:phosphatidylserine/phosphatidylglycerophosphate/cardiolipin synthase-like enzyme
MHAKVTVADDTVFVGSFNLSHSGEQNAENVLEITDSRLADQLAGFVDDVRSRYPGIELPAYPAGGGPQRPERQSFGSWKR